MLQPTNQIAPATSSCPSDAPVNQNTLQFHSAHQMTRARSRDRVLWIGSPRYGQPTRRQHARQQESRHGAHVMPVHLATRHAVLSFTTVLNLMHITLEEVKETRNESNGEDRVMTLVSELLRARMRNAGDGFKQGSGWCLNINSRVGMSIGPSVGEEYGGRLRDYTSMG